MTGVLKAGASTSSSGASDVVPGEGAPLQPPRSSRWVGDIASVLPEDHADAILVARCWDPVGRGPRVVRVSSHQVFDLGPGWATMAHLTETPAPARAVREAHGLPWASTADVLANSAEDVRSFGAPFFMSPIDLHCVKASGVTFVASLLERVVEESAHGSAQAAVAMRNVIHESLGAELASVRGGSPEALSLLELLIDRGMWSQYLEVGLGRDAEIFTKCPVLSSVGIGSHIGVLSSAKWTNSEPEAVLVVSSRGEVVGACLGNDMNLRDVEGRSALLLGRAKDNNASASVGPFIRLFDDTYGLDDLREEQITMTISGTDGYKLTDTSLLRLISRDPADLVSQLIGPHHQYPDGVALFLGTPFAPTADRDVPGQGFTHKPDDIVQISSPRLGTLTNRVQHSEDCPAWTFGLRSMLDHLNRSADGSTTARHTSPD